MPETAAVPRHVHDRAVPSRNGGVARHEDHRSEDGAVLGEQRRRRSALGHPGADDPPAEDAGVRGDAQGAGVCREPHRRVPAVVRREPAAIPRAPVSIRRGSLVPVERGRPVSCGRRRRCSRRVRPGRRAFRVRHGRAQSVELVDEGGEDGTCECPAAADDDASRGIDGADPPGLVSPHQDGPDGGRWVQTASRCLVRGDAGAGDRSGWPHDAEALLDRDHDLVATATVSVSVVDGDLRRRTGRTGHRRDDGRRSRGGLCWPLDQGADQRTGGSGGEQLRPTTGPSRDRGDDEQGGCDRGGRACGSGFHASIAAARPTPRLPSRGLCGRRRLIASPVQERSVRSRIPAQERSCSARSSPAGGAPAASPHEQHQPAVSSGPVARPHCTRKNCSPMSTRAPRSTR